MPEYIVWSNFRWAMKIFWKQWLQISLIGKAHGEKTWDRWIEKSERTKWSPSSLRRINKSRSVRTIRRALRPTQSYYIEKLQPRALNELYLQNKLYLVARIRFTLHLTNYALRSNKRSIVISLVLWEIAAAIIIKSHLNVLLKHLIILESFYFWW